jgi:epoxyqueuosine reductase
VLPGARTVVCVALCYEPARDAARDARLGRIARYAGGEDYHRVMRDRLGELERHIQLELAGARTLSYSDTGAILERDWAQRAGLGWIGKNTCLLSPSVGSYFLLGEILVDRALDASAPFATDHCGTCSRCIDACPTGAIVAPHRLDARRCISYLTIELRGPIPRELRPLVGDWIFGCDVCQEVCPWNRFAPPAREARLHARSLEGWTLERFLDLDDATFRALFETSPIRRAKRAGFLRNVVRGVGQSARHVGRDAVAAGAGGGLGAARPWPMRRGPWGRSRRINEAREMDTRSQRPPHRPRPMGAQEPHSRAPRRTVSRASSPLHPARVAPPRRSRASRSGAVALDSSIAQRAGVEPRRAGAGAATTTATPSPR